MLNFSIYTSNSPISPCMWDIYFQEKVEILKEKDELKSRARIDP
jgi:hypothetical protein